MRRERNLEKVKYCSPFVALAKSVEQLRDGNAERFMSPRHENFEVENMEEKMHSNVCMYVYIPRVPTAPFRSRRYCNSNFILVNDCIRVESK